MIHDSLVGVRPAHVARSRSDVRVEVGGRQLPWRVSTPTPVIPQYLKRQKVPLISTICLFV